MTGGGKMAPEAPAVRLVRLVDVLVAAGLAGSKSEARRLIRAGAVRVKALGPVLDR